MFENPRRGRQARNFTTNAPKILDLKSSSEQIFSRKLPLGAPDTTSNRRAFQETFCFPVTRKLGYHLFLSRQWHNPKVYLSFPQEVFGLP